MHPRDNEKGNGLEGVAYRELRLLEEVDLTPEVSQRHLAHQLGVALGVTNLLLRSLVPHPTKKMPARMMRISRPGSRA